MREEHRSRWSTRGMRRLTFGFEISIYEAHQVEVLERRRHLGRVEASIVFGDALPRPSLQGSEELATAAVLHTQVEVVFRLEGMVERHDEWVITGGEDFLLGQGPLDLVPLDHLFLAQHCICSPRRVSRSVSAVLE